MLVRPSLLITFLQMGENKIYLGGIPDDTRERDVEKLLKGYGRIRDVVVKVRNRGIKSK